MTHQRRHGSRSGARRHDSDAADRAEHQALPGPVGNAALARWIVPALAAHGHALARAPATPAAAPPRVVPAATVETMVADIETTLTNSGIESIDTDQTAFVLSKLRDLGAAGKVVLVTTDKVAHYDHTTDQIELSDTAFDLSNPSGSARVAFFHEGVHAIGWNYGGKMADDDFAKDKANFGPLKAAINRELKYYREEIRAHKIDQQVFQAIQVERGRTAADASQRLEEFDPREGSSSRDVRSKLKDVLTEYAVGKNGIETERFWEAADAFALNGGPMPDIDNYIVK